MGDSGSGEAGGEGLRGSEGGTRPRTSCTLWGSSWRGEEGVREGGERRRVGTVKDRRGLRGTHRAGGQLPIEGLGPRQHVLHAQLHGQLIDVLREGVGQACALAHQRLLCACLVLGMQWREDRQGWPPGGSEPSWGSGSHSEPSLLAGTLEGEGLNSPLTGSTGDREEYGLSHPAPRCSLLHLSPISSTYHHRYWAHVGGATPTPHLDQRC